MNFNNHKNEADENNITNSSKYKNNLIKIDEHINFVDMISELIFSNGHTCTTFIDGNIFLLQTELLDSSSNTLKSIKHCLKANHFGDVNVLLRKFRDDLFLYLYFHEVCNYSFDDDKIKKHKRNATNWMENKMKHLTINEILMFLTKNKIVQDAIQKHNLRNRWDSIGKNLNNFVHSNGRGYISLNYANITYDSIMKASEDTLYKIDYIVSVFLMILILVKPSLISSSDYYDALFLGIDIIEGSQYYIAPFIQHFIDEHINNLHPELKSFLQATVYMRIE